jgi:tetratricopeptide (TPR) repeat protein
LEIDDREMLAQAFGRRNRRPTSLNLDATQTPVLTSNSSNADSSGRHSTLSNLQMFFTPSSRQPCLWALTFLFVALCFQVAPAQTEDPTDGETDPVKLFERGQNAQAKGDLSRALALYEGALKLRPEFPEAEYQRGVALAALDRSPEAEKAFARASELRKDWALPNSALGTLLARAGRDKEAEPLLRRAVQLGAKDSVTLDSLSAVRSRAGDKEEALALARIATDDDNATASAWAWRGAVERANGNTTAALNSLEHSLQIEPKYVPALKERAELRVANGEYEHAIEDLRAALSVKPTDKDLSFRLAQVYQASGKTDEARHIYQSMGVTDSSPPFEGAGYEKLPLIDGTPAEIEAANSDDPANARPALEKLLAKNPKNAGLFARLGEVTRRNDPQKSAESYRRANEIDPTNPKYATGYAAALVQLRRFAEAEAILRRVIAAAPGEYAAHANLALALYELKRFAEALPEYEWLATTRPENAATYFFIATAHDNLGEYEQALNAYEKFLARADSTNNKLDVEKVNLRLPRLRDQISRGQGTKRKKP